MATDYAFQSPLPTFDHNLIDALPVAVYVCDRDARIVGFNRRAVQLWGREPAADERFCGSLRMIRPDGSVLRHHECPMADVLRTGEAVHNAGVIVERPDGTRVSVNVTIVPLMNASGEVAGAVNTFQDLDELKRADDAVYSRERELHDFVENATDCLHWAGPDGHILWANRAELELLGYSREEYVGHHIAEFHVDEEVVDDIFACLRRGEIVREREGRMRSKDGAIRTVLINSSARWRDGQFVHTRCFTRDITDRKRLEEAQRDAVLARDEFLSTASHELRNPVNALQLQLVALLRAVEKRGETVPRVWASDRIGQAVAATQRLVRLVENLLDVSRVSAGHLDLELEDLDFGQSVHAVIGRFQGQVKEHQIAACIAPVTGSWDRLRLEQIVTNLLSNAIKYGEENPIEVLLEGDDHAAYLSVTDHGLGIALADQPRLFERFERVGLRRRHAGFGLGLWITRQIVEAMGGELGVDSRPGEGSTFRVMLPRSPLAGETNAMEAAAR